jgi:Ca2+-binding RTX toxin-like protein
VHNDRSGEAVLLELRVPRASRAPVQEVTTLPALSVTRASPGVAGADTLNGGDGDDVFITDVFDTVIDSFAAGAGSEDRIDVSGLGVDFAWLMAHATDVNGNVLLDLGDHQITLRGVSTSTLHQDDFMV